MYTVYLYGCSSRWLDMHILRMEDSGKKCSKMLTKFQEFLLQIPAFSCEGSKCKPMNNENAKKAFSRTAKKTFKNGQNARGIRQFWFVQVWDLLSVVRSHDGRHNTCMRDALCVYAWTDERTVAKSHRVHTSGVSSKRLGAG